ncbi:MAG TPA: hypothetical protein VHE35_13480 [Kofleriaceae bacterium]|nr:hypothetical protein [Kofleriaceae bacterium]
MSELQATQIKAITSDGADHRSSVVLDGATAVVGVGGNGHAGDLQLYPIPAPASSSRRRSTTGTSGTRRT